MSNPIALLGTFLHLARASEQRQRPMVRDKLLVLAGIVAMRMGLPRIAAFCRFKVLQHNPQHLVRRWDSLEEAFKDEEFLHFLRHLQRRYPQEKAERMLATLGIELARERETYYSDDEYAAALLGVTLAQLDAMFGDAPEK